MGRMEQLAARDPAPSLPAASPARCRFCGETLKHTFVDLGMSPLCQTHIEPHRLDRMEPFYPLHARVCDACFLVQLEEYVPPREIFSEYAYFSSYSASWVAHARRYTRHMMERYGIGPGHFVVEVASNDGYLLRHFAAAGVRVRGIEPAANVAAAAEARGIPTTVQFLGAESARAFAAEHGRPDLLLGNNVLAHVPDINDFVQGLRILLAPGGLLTMEFPHLLRLMDGNQFDTIYHEHFSYFAFNVVERIFAEHGLRIVHVEELPTHGGSLRIHARHAGDGSRPVSARVSELRERERHRGLLNVATYEAFQERVKETKRRLLAFLIAAREAGRRIAGYGAPGKGNTLLNYCGIGTDFLDFTVDRSPHKQGRYTPGTRIPILDPDAIRRHRPDLILILPWNLRREIQHQLRFIRAWGGQCVVPIPEVRILPWSGGQGRQGMA